MELMSELAAPLPVTVIAELLGFPPEDFAKIKKWSDDMAEALGLNPSAEAQARAGAARDELRVYFDQVIEQVQRKPGENLLSALLAPDVEVLNREELFTNSVLLLAAGHETTTHLIGNGILALLRHPEQLALLRSHPDLLDSAIEEILRFDPPVQWTSRVAGEDMTVGGRTIPRGDILLGSVGAANRDPAHFVDPDRLDITRQENRHLSFGNGPHFCLGAALARMEAGIAIGAMVTRFPKLALTTKKLRWQKGLTFRGVRELRLKL
jgi:pimeloyl-[acyl-carrier protein] synthase